MTRMTAVMGAEFYCLSVLVWGSVLSSREGSAAFEWFDTWSLKAANEENQ